MSLSAPPPPGIALHLLHFAASQAAWRVVRGAKHVSSIAIARTLGRFLLRHTDFAISVWCYQPRTLYTAAVYIGVSGRWSGMRTCVQHRNACPQASQPQRWTLIPRWSRQRAVGGVIGLLVVMAVMGDERKHRLGGGVWWRRR
jgi:hypothetical protein